MPRAAGGRAEKLRSLVRLLSESAEIVISEWEKEELAADTSSRNTLAGADPSDPADPVDPSHHGKLIIMLASVMLFTNDTPGPVISYL